MGDSTEPKRFDRRGFLAATGIGAGVVAAGALGARLAASSSPPSSPAAPGPDEAVRKLFGELTAGGALGDCRVERVYGVYLGAIPVVMTCSRGTRFQVDVLRRESGGPLGVGNTDNLSLFVSNQGDGDTRTDEQQGLAAMTLAAALEERLKAGAEPPRLMTLDERLRAHPEASFAVPL